MSPPVVYLIVFLTVLGAAVFLFIQWWIGRPDISDELPPLVIPLTADPAEMVPPWHRAPPASAANASPVATADVAVQSTILRPRVVAQQPVVIHQPVVLQQPVVVQQPVAIQDVPPARSAQTALKVVRDFADASGYEEPPPGETIRFRRPSDEPVQLLPGRLEVVSGDPAHEEIRFVRVPGKPAELIVGRDPGDSAHHVTLRSGTVSRRHARFVYSNGRWVVANLSQTNPVIVNNEELSARDGARDLADGDRLELGEVVLRFHAR